MTRKRMRNLIAGLAGAGLVVGILTLPSAAAAPTVSPASAAPAGQSAVKSGDVITFGGSVTPGSEKVAAALKFFTPQGDPARDDVNALSQISFGPDGSISGSRTLPFIPPEGNDGEVLLEVTARNPETGEENTGRSEPLTIDVVRPAIQFVASTAPNRVEVTFSEDVHIPALLGVGTPVDENNINEWKIRREGSSTDLAPLSVSGSGDSRVLTLPFDMDQDEIVRVQYGPFLPRESYRDRADHVITVPLINLAADRIVPGVPTIDTVAGEAPQGGAVQNQDPQPEVLFDGDSLRQGHFAQVYLETNGTAGFQPPGGGGSGDTFLGEAPAEGGDVTVPLEEDLGADGVYELYGVARDTADCNPNDESDPRPKCPNPSGAGDPVTYHLDRVAPTPLFARLVGEQIQVRLTEPVVDPGGSAADWTLSDGTVVGSVVGNGNERTLNLQSQPATAAGLQLTYAPAGTAYRDAAENAVSGFTINVLDALPPLVNVAAPSQQVWTSGDAFQIEGTASAETEQVSIFVDADNNGEADDPSSPAAGPVDASSGSWSATVGLGSDPGDDGEKNYVAQGHRVVEGEPVTGPYADVPTIVRDTSEPTVNVIVPTGADVFRANEQVDIEWNATDEPDDNLGAGPILIEFSRTGSAPWQPIADNEPNDGSFTWQTPVTNTENARIRVRATDRAGNAAGNVSDAFIIDARAPFFTAHVRNDREVDVLFSELVSGRMLPVDWSIDGQTPQSTQPFALNDQYTGVRLRTPATQTLRARTSYPVAYTPPGVLPLVDWADNPVFPRIASAAEALFCELVVAPGPLRQGTAESEVICAPGPGGHTIDARGGHDLVVGNITNPGPDGEPTPMGGSNTVLGGPGKDVILAGPGNDELRGGGGHDDLTTGDGTDKAFGDGGNDILRGGEGPDLLDGGKGDDLLLGQGGADRLVGGEGNDELLGHTENDVLLGGPGKDLLLGDGGRDVLRGGSQADVVKGGRGPDRLFGNGGPDRIYGNAGGDHMVGGSGADVLTGGAGGDRIYGSGGRDILRGNAGADLLNGGASKDRCNGGGGRNTLRNC